MASASSLREPIEKAYETLGEIKRSDLLIQFDEWIKPLEKTLKLFREGGFGTIDEFCYLTRNKRSGEVSDLKKVLRLAFALNRPENKYAESDYYPFIQKLFADDLQTLRDDVVVISFNYDPYLEWLLYRAVQTRIEAISMVGTPFGGMATAVTSGFIDRSIERISRDDGFCLLKLHGTVAWPATLQKGVRAMPDCDWNVFYGERCLQSLTSKEHGQSAPPILFPWETLGQKSAFALTDSEHEPGIKAGGYTGGNVDLHDLFQTIWGRAKAEVLAANRISFIGISMHEYIHAGFRVLFEGKNTPIDLVVADSTCVGDQHGRMIRNPVNPRSVESRVQKLLDDVCPNSKRQTERVRSSFREFIANEL